MKKKSNGTVELIGRDRTPVKVCDVINGKPKVKRVIKDDCILAYNKTILWRLWAADGR